MNGYWAWIFLIGAWSLVGMLVLVTTKIDGWFIEMLILSLFFILCLCILGAGVLASIDYLTWMQAWPFEPQ